MLNICLFVCSVHDHSKNFKLSGHLESDSQSIKYFVLFCKNEVGYKFDCLRNFSFLSISTFFLLRNSFLDCKKWITVSTTFSFFPRHVSNHEISAENKVDRK